MLVGFSALRERYAINPAQPLRVKSAIGTVRSHHESQGQVENHYPPGYQPEDDFAGHFAFGLKYEEIHLEFFARLFTAVGPEPLEAWCRQEPFGQYARRAGFLYEWLTGNTLQVPDVTNGGYIEAISSKTYLTRTTVKRVRRWRINDNLPGTVDFCPLVRRTAAVEQALTFDLNEALNDLDSAFGADILMRTASWLTFKESRASFLIEKESDQGDRIQRFAHVIAQYCGQLDDPLSDSSLHTIQQGILGQDALGLGLRRSPVFVGQSTMREDIVHYIAPHYDDVPRFMQGLKAFDLATRGAAPLARAAVIAFGFVYIHPMRDGNGRIHRFLINDTLIRDGAIPDGVILPVSATITSSIDFRVGYDRTLDVFSKRLMRRYAGCYRFGELKTYEDGTLSNFSFSNYEDARFAWRYPDLTEHVLYTGKVIEHTVRKEMADEARVLVIFQRAQQRLKEVVEMPDQDASRIIRSLKENGWQISGKLKKTFPLLDDATLSGRIVEAVRSAFETQAD
ncbi:cell filamentation protein Fic [Pantoea sp. Bo_2]|uniref:Fic family protein n=1 Tax=unclassified Pantoea TaxID=2630326 RepID=UPI001231F608|nr:MULTISPECIES: Fic family protein [unclassified Pantoea]KAA5937099.1 cell filamentation protein Fic [Pantoea sp. VH_3]KAA5945920.1 cell filamentation protein Fic [Pantoea sp. VH_25]KAA5952999.1 cell filamentation protein Fic [Pantoea sp. VH_24]KAA5956754.1 cell filamentation protein Fic [Pantoea sp. VH_16]KAA5962802.1 cell filamentation protein Fic [Pantoea sp. VH_18]